MGETDAGRSAGLHGRAAGASYDWRRPTAARFRQTYWDTTTRRVIVPKFFGWGWDVNLGGLARRLHLVKAPHQNT